MCVGSGFRIGDQKFNVYLGYYGNKLNDLSIEQDEAAIRDIFEGLSAKGQLVEFVHQLFVTAAE